MTGSFTSTQTSTFTEAKARYVIEKVFEDLTAMAVRGFTTNSAVTSWKDDLLYIMKEEALEYFEIQFTIPDKEKVAIRYDVKADNSISSDADSGSLGLYSLPSTTKAGLLVHLKTGSPNYQKVNDELHNNRGYGTGQSANGTMEQQHSYSKEGYGVNRHKIGTW